MQHSRVDRVFKILLVYIFLMSFGGSDWFQNATWPSSNLPSDAMTVSVPSAELTVSCCCSLFMEKLSLLLAKLINWLFASPLLSTLLSGRLRRDFLRDWSIVFNIEVFVYIFSLPLKKIRRPCSWCHVNVKRNHTVGKSTKCNLHILIPSLMVSWKWPLALSRFSWIPEGNVDVAKDRIFLLEFVDIFLFFFSPLAVVPVNIELGNF